MSTTLPADGGSQSMVVQLDSSRSQVALPSNLITESNEAQVNLPNLSMLVPRETWSQLQQAVWS